MRDSSCRLKSLKRTNGPRDGCVIGQVSKFFELRMDWMNWGKHRWVGNDCISRLKRTRFVDFADGDIRMPKKKLKSEKSFGADSFIISLVSVPVVFCSKMIDIR